MHNSTETEIAVWLHIHPKEFQHTLKKCGFERVRHNVFQKTFIYLPPAAVNVGGVLRVRETGSITALTVKSAVQHCPSGVKQRFKKTLKVEVAHDAKIFAELLGYTYSHMRERVTNKYKRKNVNVVMNHNPYGWVVDIDGPDEAAVLEVMDELGIKKTEVIRESANERWKKYCTDHHIPYLEDISFAHAGCEPNELED